jgi:hypothetical protein
MIPVVRDSHQVYRAPNAQPRHPNPSGLHLHVVPSPHDYPATAPQSFILSPEYVLVQRH